ncbi:MAG: hypothetical protein ABW168_03370 [Sedimenticola sp.]
MLPNILQAKGWVDECKPGSPSINSLSNASGVEFCLEQAKKRLALLKIMSEIQKHSNLTNIDHYKPAKATVSTHPTKGLLPDPAKESPPTKNRQKNISNKWPLLFIDKMVFEEDGSGHADLVDQKGYKYFVKINTKIKGGKIVNFDGEGIIFYKNGKNTRLPFANKKYSTSTLRPEIINPMMLRHDASVSARNIGGVSGK